MVPESRQWVPVTIPPGAFLIQVGDLLTRWTGRAIRPNIHRVVNPPREVAATSRRLSIPYFHYPRLDLVVETAPSCRRPGIRAPRPVVAWDHTFKRQEDYSGDYGVSAELASVAADASGALRLVKRGNRAESPILRAFAGPGSCGGIPLAQRARLDPAQRKPALRDPALRNPARPH